MTKEEAIAHAKNYGEFFYTFANDRDVVLAAVKRDGLALLFVSDELRKDEEVVFAAVKQNIDALRFSWAKELNYFLNAAKGLKINLNQYNSVDELKNDKKVRRVVKLKLARKKIGKGILTIKDGICDYGPVVGICMMVGGFLASIITTLSIEAKEAKKLEASYQNSVDVLEKTIENQNGLDSFDLLTATITGAEVDNYSLISFTGTYISNEQQGSRIYGKATYKVDEEMATDILAQLGNYQKMLAPVDATCNVKINEDIGFIKEKKEYRAKTEELFTLFQNAIEKCYEHEMIEIGNEYDFNYAVEEGYYEIFPEEFEYRGRFHGSGSVTEYGEMTPVITNISQVYEDEELNKSFFYVDSLFEGAHTKMRVDVEGVGMSSAEVYASFINGKFANCVKVGSPSEFRLNNRPGNEKIIDF